jgi:hypothetical protein
MSTRAASSSSILSGVVNLLLRRQRLLPRCHCHYYKDTEEIVNLFTIRFNKVPLIAFNDYISIFNLFSLILYNISLNS